MIVKTTKIVILGTLISLIMAFSGDNRAFEISKNINIFSNVMRELDKYFVDTIHPEKLTNKALKSMLETLDPYTEFYPESETGRVKMMASGQYAGIGSLISQKNSKTIIRQPYTGSPAEKAGLLPGDTIVAIDEKMVTGLSSDQVSDLLKGKPQQTSVIEIRRHGAPESLSFHVTREGIQMPSIPYYGMLNAQTGYIYLVNFTDKAANSFKEALTDLQNRGATSLVIDLRNNGGGSLDQAVDIVGMFIPQNAKVVTMKGREEAAEKHFYTRTAPIAPEMRIAVLINRNTASASEIVSGALQDYDRAVILGERSFGKGLVQTVIDLPYKTKMKVTTAKYYIPSGRCIQAVDYSHRNPDGSVGKVPDSLMTAFKTKAGRVVYDGGGILPDIELPLTTYTNITQPIIAGDKLFDFVCIYALTHKSISPVKNFEVTDNQFIEFKKFLTKQQFKYENETLTAINALIEKAKKEKYYEKNKISLNKMKTDLTHSLEQDMDMVKDEIKEVLAYAFITRYYNNEGAVEYGSLHDKQIKKAAEIIQDSITFKSVLQNIRE